MRGAEWYGETGASSIPRPLISLCKSWNSCSTGGWEHLHQEDCNSSRCWLIPTFSRRVRHGWWFKATWSKGYNRSIQIRAVSKEEILSIVKIDWWGLIPHLQLDSDTAPASLAVVCGVVGLLSVAGNVSLTDQASLSTNQCILHLEMKQNQLLLWYQICWNAEHFKWTSRAATHWNWTDSRGKAWPNRVHRSWESRDRWGMPCIVPGQKESDGSCPAQKQLYLLRISGRPSYYYWIHYFQYSQDLFI